MTKATEHVKYDNHKKKKKKNYIPVYKHVVALPDLIKNKSR